MVTAAAAAGTDDLDLDHGDSKLFEHMLGPEPRTLFTQRATAKTLGLDVKKVKRATIEIAAAVFFRIVAGLHLFCLQCALSSSCVGSG